MSWVEALLLVTGGLFAGAINAVAGGGSMLTVPLLVLAGVPGVEANGTNRIGILTSNASAFASYRSSGIRVDRDLNATVVPALFGSAVGAYGISALSDETFERAFGLIMIPLILFTIFRPPQTQSATKWPLWQTLVIFFAIGIYAGAIQAGVGLLLLAALSRAGFDLVTANMIKVIFSFFATLIALPVFILGGNVRWLPGLVLAVGLTVGGWVGAKLAVRGGEKWIRAVMVIAALALSIRLILG